MEWDDFKYFLAVARSGSLTGAARALKTSAATVGRRIMTLEARLGARLFDRGQTGYALTDSGEAIRLKAEEILAQRDQTDGCVLIHSFPFLGVC
jgi:DNA-binding transcriptional LysR family regulator